FICVVSLSAFSPAFSHNETFNKPLTINVTEGISQDSISKSEIADYRKRFESVEKMIASKRGNYADAKSSFDGLRRSRVSKLSEFSGRLSAMQQKLTAWNLEVNPKTPPVVVPNNPNPTTPRNTGKTNEPVAKMTSTEIEHKSLMLSYFPDTLSVGNEFLAYVEITKDNTVKFGNLNAGNNTTLDSIIITSLAGTPGVTPGTQVSIELTRDGGADNFAITSRSDKTKTLSDNGTSRWEWNLRPNAEGDTRLRLNVTYKKISKDGASQDVTAINKFIVVKGLAKKTTEPKSNNTLWIILAVAALLGLIGYLLSRGKKNKHERNRVEQNRLDEERIEQSRNEQKRINRDRDDLDK
ncbi:MAG: hypothetical protein KBG21_09535, partial [Ignavibacteria bacterium]|nr:hypothetical protein [Ignavibacteria bacterium]